MPMQLFSNELFIVSFSKFTFSLHAVQNNDIIITEIQKICQHTETQEMFKPYHVIKAIGSTILHKGLTLTTCRAWRNMHIHTQQHARAHTLIAYTHVNTIREGSDSKKKLHRERYRY